MKIRSLRIIVPVVALAIALMLFALPLTTTQTAQAFNYSKLNKIQKRLISGAAEAELNPESEAKKTLLVSNYIPSKDDGCDGRFGDNIKVNQNCQNVTDPDLAGRGQANNETSIATDPNNPKHLVASYNDYRRGDGNCYAAYSQDGGENWTDTTVPMGFVRGSSFGYGAARQYWQAGGDTSVAWDSRGNAYLSCQVFNRGPGVTQDPDQSSAFLIFRSTSNSGASWNFPGRVVTGLTNSDGTALLDKQLMTVDNHASSPYRDRVYVSWTLFAPDGTAYIYEAYSSDYGETFSKPVLVSKDSPLCVNTFGVATPNGNCNENQFSQPFTGADGALYVVFANFNNGIGNIVGDPDSGGGANINAPTSAPSNDNRNQMLLVKSTDGGATFGDPVKVSDYYDLPDCAAYQAGKDAGRSCVPEKGSTSNSFFRATNYPVGAVNPKDPGQVVVTLGSYINAYSNEKTGCVPDGFSAVFGLDLYQGVKTLGACSNHILVSVSNNGGKSFTGTTTDPRKLTTATDGNRQRQADQWFQWADFSRNGFAVSYYDRQYGNDEVSGYSDFSLASSGNLKDFNVERATTSSMPPPSQFAGVFWGDYTGMATADNKAYPIWSDTRNAELFVCPGTAKPGVPPALCTAPASNAPLANEQEVYVTKMEVSSH
ncbi:MAG TPA: sialidase family protein [Chloroflexia bacterium]|nr:sialidase family protein [Chloroflexia bacterium]